MTVDMKERHFFQAVCNRCGWHTREYTNKPTVQHFADLHEPACPNPEPPRHGALMECGCWYHASSGSSVGRTKSECPVHGLTLMAEANVDEPNGEAHGAHWTMPADSHPPTEPTKAEGLK